MAGTRTAATFPSLALICGTLATISATSAHAQQPYSFVLTTGDRSAAWLAAPLTVFGGQRLDPMTGVASTFGRFTVVGMEDSRFESRDPRRARQAEFLVDLFQASNGFTIGAGSGIRREIDGANVLLTRIIVEQPSFGGRVSGNVVLERPLAEGRDALDVITSVGWSRRISPVLAIGIETLAEDLEGFWEGDEAEGGARLFAGPSADIGSSGSKWTLHVTAGADLRATQTAGSSDALRALGRSGLVMRLSLRRVF